MDAATLCGLFIKAADNFGYDQAQALVVPLPKLGIKWVRNSEGWIRFDLPDYLLALTERAAYDLADGLMRRITEGGITVPYTGLVDSELSSEAFAKAAQPDFLDRNDLRHVPACWLEYCRLAREQGVELPAMATARTGDLDTVVSMRVAILPDVMAEAPIRDQLEYLDAQMVLIARGLRGCNAASAPARFVEVA